MLWCDIILRESTILNARDEERTWVVLSIVSFGQTKQGRAVLSVGRRVQIECGIRIHTIVCVNIS